MENKYLAKILPFLNEIEKERREQSGGCCDCLCVCERGVALCEESEREFAQKRETRVVCEKDRQLVY